MTSRYEYAPLYHGQYYGLRTRIKIPPHETDMYHRITEGEHIDLIAWRYYGDVNLWWVICDVNGVANPLALPVGTTLRIPSYERVRLMV